MGLRYNGVRGFEANNNVNDCITEDNNCQMRVRMRKNVNIHHT